MHVDDSGWERYTRTDQVFAADCQPNTNFPGEGTNSKPRQVWARDPMP